MKHPHINLRKAWEILKKHEHPSADTLNRIALLTGFQTWEELQHALHEGKDNEEQEGQQQTDNSNQK